MLVYLVVFGLPTCSNSWQTQFIKRKPYYDPEAKSMTPKAHLQPIYLDRFFLCTHCMQQHCVMLQMYHDVHVEYTRYMNMCMHTYHTYVLDVLLSFLFVSVIYFLFLFLRRMGKNEVCLLHKIQGWLRLKKNMPEKKNTRSITQMKKYAATILVRIRRENCKTLHSSKTRGRQQHDESTHESLSGANKRATKRQ